MYRDLRHKTEEYIKEALPISEFPPEDSYEYVLQRFDLRPNKTTTCVFVSYSQQCRSTPVIIGERIAQTIFVKDWGAKQKAVRDGWVDLTEDWKKHIIKVVPRATSPSQQKIMEFLEGQPKEDWFSKTKIISTGKVPESQWRTSIKTLLERGLVEKYGVGKAARYRVILQK